jgi:hypothetical protein
MMALVVKSAETQQVKQDDGSSTLEWNGKGSISSWDGTDAWNNCTAVDLGFPSGAKYQVASGVWRGDFARGCVHRQPHRVNRHGR